MTRTLTIVSAKDGGSLSLCARGGNLIVGLKVGGLGVTIGVDSYMSSGLPMFFEEMARDWRGWDSKKSWESIDGDFRMECEHDRVGHIYMRISLTNYEQQWSVEGKLVLEPGMLEQLASDARAFYDSTGWTDE